MGWSVREDKTMATEGSKTERQRWFKVDLKILYYWFGRWRKKGLIS